MHIALSVYCYMFWQKSAEVIPWNGELCCCQYTWVHAGRWVGSAWGSEPQRATGEDSSKGGRSSSPQWLEILMAGWTEQTTFGDGFHSKQSSVALGQKSGYQNHDSGNVSKCTAPYSQIYQQPRKHKEKLHMENLKEFWPWKKYTSTSAGVSLQFLTSMTVMMSKVVSSRRFRRTFTSSSVISGPEQRVKKTSLHHSHAANTKTFCDQKASNSLLTG